MITYSTEAGWDFRSESTVGSIKLETTISKAIKTKKRVSFVIGGFLAP